MAEHLQIKRQHALHMAQTFSKRRTSGHRPSLASAQYMRVLRDSVAGWLACFFANQCLKPLFVTLMPHGWAIPAAELDSVDPQRLIRQLKAQLIRLGASDVDGGLFGGLDCEYDPDLDRYFFHMHLVVWGELTTVVRKLRTLKAYQYNADALSAGTGAVHPVRVQEIDDNLLSCLTYIVKGFWSQRVRVQSSDLHVRRTRGKCRITGPAFVQHLLWLDRQRPRDLYFMMKVQVTKHGFQPLKSRSPNGINQST